MKKILLLFLSCFSCTIAEAQTTPPLFQGSDDVQLFRQALMERVTEVYYSDGYTPDDLIHYFWMNFTIDTLGRCIDLEIPDTCRRQTIIVKERTLELLRTALAGIDSFQPATERGEKVPSRQTMEYDYEGENETYIEASVENSSSILYDKEIRNKPRTRRTKRNV